ncbi:MAG: hypothetical protein ACOYUZ_03655 [Patescibacteria group bacterium]
MNKFTLFSIFAVTLLFLANGCVQVEQLENKIDVPQIDQVSEEDVSALIVTTSTEEVDAATSTITTTSTKTSDDADEAESAEVMLDTDEEEGSAQERYCKRYSGIYSEIHAPDEVWGACYFQDGSMCEIMSFMRGECNMGGCKEECKNQGSRSEGWYDSCSNKLIRWADCAE